MNDIRLVIWDFDGVIVLSDKVRVEGFRRIFENYPKNHVDELLEFHAANGGLSRYVKIRYFFEKIRGENISEETVVEFANRFAVLMKVELIKKAYLNPDWIKLMEKIDMRFEHHIASGSDGNELRYLCGKLGISNFFKSIHGSPIPKTQLVKDILFTSGIAPDNSVLIGDAFNDYEAAKSNGVRFFGYNNAELVEVSDIYVHSLYKDIFQNE